VDNGVSDGLVHSYPLYSTTLIIKMEEKLTTCVHRLFQDCKNCKYDLDRTHHPNNYDCSRYIPITVGYFEVRDKEHENQDVILGDKE